jgi:hypothetical protein
MNKGTIALTGLGIGAGVMYLLDPAGGKRRRARARYLVVHSSHTVKNAAGAASRDLEHRVAGLAARTHALLSAHPAPSDDVLAERVRARVGRLVSHPGAIEVKADSGVISLSGPVFAAESARLVHGVRAVPGVTRVDDRLERHAEAGNVSALQGRGAAHAGGWHWTPTTQVMAGAAGLALMALAARRRTIRGTAVGLAGFELFEQALRGLALTHQEPSRRSTCHSASRSAPSGEQKH